MRGLRVGHCEADKSRRIVVDKLQETFLSKQDLGGLNS